MNKKYAIGIDYGTLSGRALICDITTGYELATAALDYPHAVMDETFLDGSPLPPDFALQHPGDYLEALYVTVPKVVAASGVSVDDIIGIGVDFTTCSPLPVTADGIPLCFTERFATNPHAYVKLWKHHAAQKYANKLNEELASYYPALLEKYGGKISSEWMIPKIWQTLAEAPEVFNAADYFVESADWLVWQLCGTLARNSCMAGYKAMYNPSTGYAPADLLGKLDKRLTDLASTKLGGIVVPIGTCAGGLTEKMAKKLGLRPGIAVAVATGDAHVTVPALSIGSEGKLLAIMGTSTCHMILGRAGEPSKLVPGMCGAVEDGIVPGFVGYEAGQSCVGDHFAWFADNLVPSEYKDEAKTKGISIHKLLAQRAEKLVPGKSGLVALDWWNGNRSVLVDADLTGLFIGMTLSTKPEELYRALVEATAYGTRVIVENFIANGVPVDEFFAAGGIAEKDPFTMQLYADVLGMEIKISGSAQAPALGSAIFGAVAGGAYNSVSEASLKMGKIKEFTYKPNPAAKVIYDKLFAEYKLLHDYFGRGGNDVMKRLKVIAASVKNS
jgi:L-ribulokinase